MKCLSTFETPSWAAKISTALFYANSVAGKGGCGQIWWLLEMGDVSAVSGCLSGPSLAAASFVSSWASAREAALCRAALCCHRRSLRFWLHRIPTAAVWMHSRWFLLCCLKFKPRQFWSTQHYTNIWKDDLTLFAFKASFILIVITECSVPLLYSCKAVVCCGVLCILQKFF